GTAINLNSWRSTTGNDQHSQALSAADVDDLFRDFDAHDFWLSDESSARDFGVAMLAGKSAPSADLLGKSRPSGASHDAGAYEYQSSGPRQSLAAISAGDLVVARSNGTAFV